MIPLAFQEPWRESILLLPAHALLPQNERCEKCNRRLGYDDYRTICRFCKRVPAEIPRGALLKTNPKLFLP